MPYVYAALAVAALAVAGPWLRHRHNARLTDKMIALVGTKPTWLFMPFDVAHALGITPEKADKLIAALPTDDSRYCTTEGGIRFWCKDSWDLKLLACLEQDVLTYIAAYPHQLATAKTLALALHNPLGTIIAVLQDLANKPGTGGIAYSVGRDYQTIMAHGISADTM